jgi:ornithine cyclodeaminase/alanine dehydrogenase-like protein (mu-crystallin family)
MKLHLTEQNVLSTLTMPKAIELVEQAFRQLADGTAINHPRRRVVLPTGSVLHYMAAGTPNYFGTKVYSTNAKSGAHFEVLLFRSSDGIPLANIEANHLGQIRTGAASGVATKFLARKDAKVAAVIGSGFQAETQLEAIAQVRQLSEVRVWSRKPERRADFARRCAARFGLNVRATETARECVESADIVITMTSSREPVLESSWIAPGTHINAAGANWADRRELPVDLILNRNALVTTDAADVAKLEAPPEYSSAVELKEVVVSRTTRASANQITIFKSQGLAVEDIAVAGYIWEMRLSGA